MSFPCAPLLRAPLLLLALSFGVIGAPRATPLAAQTPDPRVGLAAGWWDAKDAIQGLRHVGFGRKPDGWYNSADPGDFAFANSDLAFTGNYVIQGGWNGFQVWDLSTPSSPKLFSSYRCVGGQGDPSVYGNLLFISVEATDGRLDCAPGGATDTVSKERFVGVRIFDITDKAKPKLVTQVQTCRGSHTHTLVTSPSDKANLYVYVSGTSPVRSPSELAGCSGRDPKEDPNSSLFRIEVIRVPLAAPQDARIVNAPRVFADASGNAAGLWAGGSHGDSTQNTARTDQCHDITVYPAIGLAAGACSGNGILLDIKDPANPKRIAQVIDPNFAYWHSATFSNDGRTVLWSDEWGGGTQARCQATDRPTWGADAIFRLDNGKLTPAGYYKLPAAQTASENCVAHNGNLIPVPGRNIMVQAWYQGGISVFDFTDPSNAREIAFYDRGPVDAQNITLAGHWAGYWYNGHIVASEIARGIDVFELVPSEHLSQNEIDAAKSVRTREMNAQLQERITWPPSYSVARAYLDQLERGNGLSASRITAIRTALTDAEKLSTPNRTRLRTLARAIDRDVTGAADATRVRLLAAAVRDLAQ